jgi:hypothetical protein
LQWNEIDDEGAKVLAFSFMKCNSVRGIGLVGNNISSLGGRYIIEGFQTLESNTSTASGSLLDIPYLPPREKSVYLPELNMLRATMITNNDT